MPKRSRSGAFIPFSSYTKGTKSRSNSGSRRRNALVRVPRDKLGFPQAMKATLRYTLAIDHVLDNLMAHVKTIRANDLYNPEKGGGAIHQPRSFDQYMQLYNTFTVQGSRCAVNYVYEGYNGPSTQFEIIGPPSSTNLIQEIGATTDKIPALPPVMCGIHKGTEQLAAGEPEKQMEKDRTVWKIMTPNSGSVTLKSKCRTSDFYGKPALTGSEGYTGTVSNGPTNEIFYEVWAGRATDQHIPANSKCLVRCFITVEYDAVFTDPKTLAAS